MEIIELELLCRITWWECNIFHSVYLEACLYQKKRNMMKSYALKNRNHHCGQSYVIQQMFLFFYLKNPDW